MDEKALKNYWKLRPWEVEEVRSLLMGADEEGELVKYAREQLHLHPDDAQEFAQDAMEEPAI